MKRLKVEFEQQGINGDHFKGVRLVNNTLFDVGSYVVKEDVKRTMQNPRVDIVIKGRKE